jgi:hypothetical protein
MTFFSIVILLVAMAPRGAMAFEAYPRCFLSHEKLKSAKLTDEELLARLSFAEGMSTSCPNPAVFESISWGVANRAKLGHLSSRFKKKYGRGIPGVIFKAGQFNPAVSSKSRFSKLFLCPTSEPNWALHWTHVVNAAQKVMTSPEKNPFFITHWEKMSQVSLVTHFYYPKSEQATGKAPKWANPARSLKKVQVAGAELDTQCIWFFRNEKPFHFRLALPEKEKSSEEVSERLPSGQDDEVVEAEEGF